MNEWMDDETYIRNKKVQRKIDRKKEQFYKQIKEQMWQFHYGIALIYFFIFELQYSTYSF